jgi:hypothetical protein
MSRPDDFARRWQALTAAARHAPAAPAPPPPDLDDLLRAARRLPAAPDPWILWERWSLRTFAAVAALLALAAAGVLADAWSSQSAPAPLPALAGTSLATTGDGALAAVHPPPAPIPGNPP